MKKIMNTPETFVYDMCHGLAAAHPELEFVEKFKVVKKKEINRNKVTLISGGGSGHEPAHAGFVGKGMLDAAVCGDVFASPSQIQVYEAIKATASDKGTLLIISHQERILSIADEIVVIDDGMVREQGARDEILPKLLGEEKADVCPLGKEATAL